MNKLIDVLGVLIWITIVYLAIQSAVMCFAALVLIGYLVSKLI